mmetsp:Transcript_19568/g.59245  ORF Transcript_19568/g.59245 Transcript_19568/m.59245 type:complete len:245 (-) Transcript_19568:619-1353(-)
MDEWGFFEETERERETALHGDRGSYGMGSAPRHQTPGYILEEALVDQVLWHMTAGRRPKQPEDVKRIYEKLWEENFARSEVSYDSLSSKDSTERLGRDRHTIIVDKATCPYGYAASKSFRCPHCGHIASVMIHVPRLRVVKDLRTRRMHAEYLVIVHNGELTFGVWRRHTDFQHFVNFLRRSQVWVRFRKSFSRWRELRSKRKWYRCLDKEYLILKCFLLERFLQQVLAESKQPYHFKRLLDLS